MFCIRGYHKNQEIPRLPQSIIYQMDRDIVQQEALKEDGEHSKLWCYEQALEIVIENMGADEIQSIILLSPESKPTNVQAKEKKFLEMENLTLIIGNVQFHEHLEFLPNGFTQLDWDKYPFPWRPSDFCPKKLVVLNMYLNLSVRYVNSFKSDLNLGDQNHVELFCEIKRRLTYWEMAPNIKAIGVHVECNCPQPQNGEAWGLSMDNYEARSCTCLCGAQTCCRCLKELGSVHSAGRAAVHSSNLES
ncbi:hypothetical protein CMV_028120 [Castanea mollissima]|uniref:Uncharacterized protein n=1 Tax=Castanea mollissima TaxID=60419 RepID=A0A8J4QI36_9ROSI|nr:hypothetical protein CMV_028120 [Castanea mollissima]